jgi:hypothetical protein
MRVDQLQEETMNVFEGFEGFVGAIRFGLLAIVIIAVVGIIAAIPMYYLWNWLMPELFGLKIITFWQALGLVFLSGLLFKNTFSASKS